MPGMLLVAFMSLVAISLAPHTLVHAQSDPLLCDPTASRVGCGFIGTTKEDCLASNCCWDEVNPNPNLVPWCYRNNLNPGVSATPTPGASVTPAPGDDLPACDSSGKPVSGAFLWDAHVCAFGNMTRPVTASECAPFKISSTCAAAQLRGIAVVTHALGACPAHVRSLAERLRSECYDTYAPVLPGHGFACSEGGECLSATGGAVFIPSSNNSIVNGSEISQLPTNRAQYLAYADWLRSMADQEAVRRATANAGVAGWSADTGMSVVLLGHDLGAALSALATVPQGLAAETYTGAAADGTSTGSTGATLPTATAASTATTSEADGPSTTASSDLTYPPSAVALIMPSFGLGAHPGAAATDPATYMDLDRCTRGARGDTECARIWADLAGLGAVRDDVARLVARGIIADPSPLATADTGGGSDASSSSTTAESAATIGGGATAEAFSARVRVALERVASAELVLSGDDATSSAVVTAANPYLDSSACAAMTSRPGLCHARFRNVLAAHAAGMYAMRSAREADGFARVLVLGSDRSGPESLSLAISAAAGLARKGTARTVCVHRRALACALSASERSGADNSCGVPHLSLSEPEALALPPQVMYWNISVVVGTVEWVKGNTAASYGLGPGQSWGGARSDPCVPEVPSAPSAAAAPADAWPAYAVLSVPAITEDRDSALEALRSAVATAGRVPAHSNSLVRVVDASRAYASSGSSGSGGASGTERILVEMPNSAARVIQGLGDAGASLGFGAQGLAQVNTLHLDGEPAAFFANPGTDIDTGSGSGRSTVATWVFILVVGVLLGMLVILTLVFARRVHSLVERQRERESGVPRSPGFLPPQSYPSGHPSTPPPHASSSSQKYQPHPAGHGDPQHSGQPAPHSPAAANSSAHIPPPPPPLPDLPENDDGGHF